MKVRRIAATGVALPDQMLEPAAGLAKESEFSLLLNKIYTVYGFTLDRGYIWYYLYDEDCINDSKPYPGAHPSPLFEVVDRRLSKYWEFGLFSNDKGDYWIEVAYPEWARDRYYYDSLTDGEDDAVDVFAKYKQLIDVEYEKLAE